MKEIKRLNINKDSQSPIIPITIIHENMNIFAELFIEKGKIDNKEEYGLVSILPKLSKILKRILLSKYQFTLISFHQTNNVDFENDIVCNTVF